MQIVINISEEDLDAIKELKSNGYASRHELRILQGKPLPKGHGALKDADVMINKLCTHEASELFGSVTCAEILDFINDEKPIIEADKEE